MGSKVLLLLAVLLLATPVAAVAQGPSPSTALVKSTFGLGFGPQSVEPIAFGVPVYTVGDQIWVQTYANASTLLATLAEPSPPGESGVQAQVTYLQPGSLTRLYAFKASDPLGNWTLRVFPTSGGPTLSVTIQVTEPPLLVPTYEGANVTGSELSLGYSLPATSAYSVQECTIGASESSTSSFQLPRDIGGTLNVSLKGSVVTASDIGAGVTFTGWLELYASRAFQTGGALVSEETMAAKSQGLFSINSTSVTSKVLLTQNLVLRPGRYDLRVYVRGPSGLASYDAPYVLINGTAWLSLGGCTQLVNVASQGFQMTTNLESSNSTWPRLLYTMYTEGGVDGVTALPVPVSEARIDVRNNATLGRVGGLEMSVQGAGVQAWSSFNSGAYLIGTSYPLMVNLTVDFGGVTAESYLVNVTAPFQLHRIRVVVGTLVVSTTANGGPLVNATVAISALGSGGRGLFSPNLGGNVSVTLPPGEYEANASFSGKSGVSDVQVLPGQTAALHFDLSTGGIPRVFYLLGAVLVAGVVGNVIVWRTFLERRRG